MLNHSTEGLPSSRVSIFVRVYGSLAVLIVLLFLLDIYKNLATPSTYIYIDDGEKKTETSVKLDCYVISLSC